MAEAAEKPDKKLLRPSWRYRELFDLLGNSDEVRAKIAQAGFRPPPIATVRGWAFRRSIPSKWLLVLLLVAFEEGRLGSIRDLDGEVGGDLDEDLDDQGGNEC